MANVSSKEWLRIREARASLSGEEREKAMEGIVAQYSGLLYKAASDARKRGATEDFSDLLQRGVWGLKEAVNRFQRGKVKFATFAYPQVLVFMVRGAKYENDSDLAKLKPKPLNAADDAIDIMDVIESEADLPVYIKKARKKRLDEETVIEEQKEKYKGKSFRPFISLDQSFTHDGDGEDGDPLLNVIASTDDQFKDTLVGEIWQIANGLPERIREVLEMRYKDDMTLEAIGEEIGLTRERVRQLEEEGLAYLKRKINGNNGNGGVL